ncbi:hypothetical protein PCE1_003106 [Barthelona sp. PCE]
MGEYAIEWDEKQRLEEIGEVDTPSDFYMSDNLDELSEVEEAPAPSPLASAIKKRADKPKKPKDNRYFSLKCDICESKDHGTSECPFNVPKVCYLCGGPHPAQDCDFIICRNCGEFGHLKSNCKNQRRPVMDRCLCGQRHSTMYCNYNDHGPRRSKRCPGPQFQTFITCMNCGGDHFTSMCGSEGESNSHSKRNNNRHRNERQHRNERNEGQKQRRRRNSSSKIALQSKSNGKNGGRPKQRRRNSRSNSK